MSRSSHFVWLLQLFDISMLQNLPNDCPEVHVSRRTTHPIIVGRGLSDGSQNQISGPLPLNQHYISNSGRNSCSLRNAGVGHAQGISSVAKGAIHCSHFKSSILPRYHISWETKQTARMQSSEFWEYRQNWTGSSIVILQL